MLCAFIVSGCSTRQSKKLFERIPSKNCGIDFFNKVENTEDFNIFSYRNFYNGGGVAIGDINNDGLSDVYLTSNLGDNRLFLNKGNFNFEDITESAGVMGTKSWSTGVIMVDINNDGLLDIYVCNAGYVQKDDQENELFINNGDLTFSEKAKDYNLNENGYTTHAAFFDYDQDGDLDAYILNNSFIPVNTLNYSDKRELYAHDWPVKDFIKGGGDKLLRNDAGHFTDVTREAGIYGSLIGFGLGITIGDINGDHLPDMYVSNDFFERDYLYINQGNGTFKEDIMNWMEHISLSSMGADMADLNNDGFPEIFVTEMLPDDEYRLKTKTLFENYNIYDLKLKRDFYHQYMHNTLQYNNKNQSFSEISWYSGTSASDWSWGALMFDADNDGFRDIYVCNGVYQDVTDQDFMDFFANEIAQKMALTGEKEDMQKVLDKMPSEPQLNKFFYNNGDLTFLDAGEQRGFETPSFSNGAAYGDLDNDGDLDLIVNNLNQEVFVYRNNSESLLDNHYLKVRLKGPPQNTFAIGTKVHLYKDNQILSFQMIPSRGFQSSIDYNLVFGLGTSGIIDSLVIIWPDQTKYTQLTPPPDTTLVVDYNQVNNTLIEVKTPYRQNARQVLYEVPTSLESHQENAFVDFYQEGLIMRMVSREGPKAAVGDVNGDGLDDIFIGDAAKKEGKLYIQTVNGFMLSKQETFVKHAYYEDTAAEFFDVDQDGDLDLFVGSGGNQWPEHSQLMQDRLYLNNGKGSFSFSQDGLPNNGYNTAVALPFDMDEDGDTDLFVGSRSIPNKYGISPPSFLYENDGNGKFQNVGNTLFPALENLGMITDATLVDLTGDTGKELVITGEWMSPRIFEKTNGRFQEKKSNLLEYSGWWYTVISNDLDGDGDEDLVLGNRGENFYFTGSSETPAKLWLGDFDNNGGIEKIVTRNINGNDMPTATKKELTEQIVSLKKQNLKHTEYATRSIQALFSEDILKTVQVKEGNWFKSSVALNNGDGNFTMVPLPPAVQFSCVCDIYCTDLNGDGKADLIIGGNDSGFTPQFSKLDASFGHVLINKGDGNFETLGSQTSGFFIKGDVKQFLPLNIKEEKHILAAINNKKPKLFKINTWHENKNNLP